MPDESEFHTVGAASFKTTEGKGSVDTRNGQRVSVCRA